MKFLTAIQRISPLRVAILAAIVILCVGAVVGGVVLRGAENHEIVQTQFKTYRFYADVPSKILINGETVHGMTPQSLDLDLDPPFTVVFMTDDAPDYSFKVQDDPDVEITSFAVNMKPKNVDDPMLELETVPRDATVFINGQRQFDETPCKIPIDVDDPFQIVIQKKGYKIEKIFVASHGDHVKILSNLLKKDDKNLEDKPL